jgi:hypothetical protein
MTKSLDNILFRSHKLIKKCFDVLKENYKEKSLLNKYLTEYNNKK